MQYIIKYIYDVIYYKMHLLCSILENVFIMQNITKCNCYVVYYKMYLLCIVYYKKYLLCSILQNIFIMQYITRSIYCVVYYKIYLLCSILQSRKHFCLSYKNGIVFIGIIIFSIYEPVVSKNESESKSHLKDFKTIFIFIFI